MADIIVKNGKSKLPYLELKLFISYLSHKYNFCIILSVCYLLHEWSKCTNVVAVLAPVVSAAAVVVAAAVVAVLSRSANPLDGAPVVPVVAVIPKPVPVNTQPFNS